MVFGVPVRGSVPLLLAECLLYVVTTLAIGIVISTAARTQRTAMLAALAGLLLPTLMLSGFIFPIDSMPTPLRVFSNIVPARWFLVIVRGIMLKGSGLGTLWQETLILVGLTLALLASGHPAPLREARLTCASSGCSCWKEFLQVFRDPATAFQILVIPIFQLLILSNAATFDVPRAALLVVDEDRSTCLGATGRPARRQRAVPRGGRAAHRGRRGGGAARPRRARDAAHPRALRARPRAHGRAPVLLSLDAEDGASAGILQTAATAIIARPVARPDVGEPGRRLRRPWCAPARRSTCARATGSIRRATTSTSWCRGCCVSLTTIIGLLVTAQNIVREKELGTLEQLNVSPITRGQFLLGKLLPFWILAMIIFTIGMIVGVFVFGIPTVGSVPLVFLSAGVYLIVALGIGLLISTIARTQQQVMFVAFFLLLLYLLLSGIFTPLESAPRWAQWIAEANPVKHFVFIMRTVLVRGGGLAEVGPTLAGLAVAGVAVMAAGGAPVRQAQ